jgi:hypothetical protein
MFVLARIFDLHAHGHAISFDGHQHETTASQTHHVHQQDKTHFVSFLNDSQDLANPECDDTNKSFEIEHEFIIKKLKHQIDTNLFLVAIFVLFVYFLARAVRSRVSPETSSSHPIKRLFVNQPPLRAPPFQA